MKKSSIFLKINIIFIISLLCVTLAFVGLFIGYIKRSGIDFVSDVQKRFVIARYQIRKFKAYDIDPDRIYSNNGFMPVEQHLIEGILKGAIVYKIRDKLDIDDRIDDFSGDSDRNSNTRRHMRQMIELTRDIRNFSRGLDLFSYKDDIYILDRGKNVFKLYKNTYKPNVNNSAKYFIIGIYLFVAISLFVLFRTLKKTFIPLKKLEREIKKVSMGDLNVNTKMQGGDEIATVSNEFHKSIEKIKDLQNARALFLRNIMHELKTPITKGRISTAIMDNDRNKELLENIFLRLELLINEANNIEQITSKNYDLGLNSYRVIDLIDSAKDMLFLNDNTSIGQNFSNETVEVDFKLFSIAIKNLIDNALKHSKDKSVDVYLQNEELHFKSKGERINDIEEYLRPFHRGNSNSRGFGLGLYIVDEILKLHNFKLLYAHEKGFNIFKISIK